MADESYRYKVPDFAKKFPKPDKKGAPGNAVRSWSRRGLIRGVHQHRPNTEYRFTASGVREAWLLWADHKGLDPVEDMPDAVRKIVATIGETVSSQPILETPTVKIEVPPGVAVEVVYRAA